MIKISRKFYQDWLNDINEIRDYLGQSSMKMPDLIDFDRAGRRKQEERIEGRERMERAAGYKPSRQRVTIKDNRTGKTISDTTQTVYHLSERE